MADFLQSLPTRPSVVDGIPPNPLILGLGGGGLLKKKTEKVAFADYDITLNLAQGHKSVADRLRLLDAYHLHSPTDAECTKLNIPNSRLNLLLLKDVLYLSGGLVGTRFSSEELSELREITHGMSLIWSNIESVFKSLDNSGKKLILSDEALSAPSDETDNSPFGLVRQFHQLADDYLVQCIMLQQLIRRMQGSIDTSEQHGIQKFDADPESKIGKKLPDWLSALMEAFNSDSSVTSSGAASNAPTSSSANTSFTVGKFAVFLSTIMIQQQQQQQRQDVTPGVSEALSILVQASSDSESTSTVPLSAPLRPHGQRYWATRFFNFLSALSELQSKPKGENALQALTH